MSRSTLRQRLRWRSGADSPGLLDAARAQDEDAVMAMIDRCSAAIAAALAERGFTPASSRYDDARNETLLAIYRQLPTFRGDAQPCTWMGGVAKRVAASRIHEPERRETRRRERLQHYTIPQELVDSGLSEKQMLLLRVMGDLDADDRRILLLRLYVGRSTREVAAELGISESGVKSRLSRAKRNAVVRAQQLERDE